MTGCVDKESCLLLISLGDEAVRDPAPQVHPYGVAKKVPQVPSPRLVDPFFHREEKVAEGTRASSGSRSASEQLHHK